jgi:glycosyltransferase involved in cell wall biosynthesis
MIDDHLQSVSLPLSAHYDGIHGPRIEILNSHLSSEELLLFYRSCDAFVLPTHAEGWGLPTHEAMAMGLPVVTTNWGGSTEFLNPENALLLDVVDLIDTSGGALPLPLSPLDLT